MKIINRNKKNYRMVLMSRPRETVPDISGEKQAVLGFLLDYV